MRKNGIAKTNIGGLSVGARLLADDESNSKIKNDLHDSYKRTLNNVTGKEAGKAAAFESKKQGEVIARQQQTEQLRLAEATSDIKKRQLLSKSGGRTNLMRSLG